MNIIKRLFGQKSAQAICSTSVVPFEQALQELQYEHQRARVNHHTRCQREEAEMQYRFQRDTVDLYRRYGHIGLSDVVDDTAPLSGLGVVLDTLGDLPVQVSVAARVGDPHGTPSARIVPDDGTGQPQDGVA